MIVVKTQTLTQAWIDPTDPHRLVFWVDLPLRYRVEDAHFRLMTITGQGIELVLRTRQFGSPVQKCRFLAVTMAPFDSLNHERPLPRIVPGPQDPADSSELQWSFWQSRRVGGTIYTDIFDITGINVEGVPLLKAVASTNS